MKSKLYNYLRYHHFNTNPAKESHSNFISVLNHFEHLTGVSNLGENGIKEDWERIKEGINKLSKEDINCLLDKVNLQ